MTTLTVTATQGGSTANGMILRIFVVTGAKAVASQTGGAINLNNASNTNTWSASITTTSGSNVYGGASMSGSGNSPTVVASTLVDSFSDTTNAETYCSWKSLNVTTGATSRGLSASPAAAGFTGAFEILAATTLAEDASAPALASTTSATTVTSASFTPPDGSLIVAIPVTDGGASATTCSVTDNLGVHLNWVQKTANPAAGNDYAGVWIADVPAGAGAAPAAWAPPLPGPAWHPAAGPSAPDGTPFAAWPVWQGADAGAVTITATASLAGAGSVAAVVTQDAGVLTVLAGAGSVADVVTQAVTAALTGAGAVNATGSGGATATLAGAGAVTAVATQIVTAASAGAGSVTAVVTQDAGTATSLAGAGAVNAGSAASAAAIASQAVSLTGPDVLPGLPGGQAFAAWPVWEGATSGPATITATASLAGAGSVAAAVTQDAGNLTALTAAGSLTDVVTQAVTASLTGAGAVNATALGGTATASIAAAGSLTDVVTQAVTATAAGAGSVTAPAVQAAKAALTAAGSLTAAGQITGTANLTGAGSLTASATTAAGSLLAAAGTVTPLAGLRVPASLSGTAAVTAVSGTQAAFTVGTLTASDAPGGGGGTLTASDQRTGGPG